MAKGNLQEKEQVIARGKINDGEGWATFESTRRTYSGGIDNQISQGHAVDSSADTSMPLSLAGATDASNAVDSKLLRKGYRNQRLSPQEDMYNMEHTDLFYGEATVDGETGFVERNNYLDRN